MNNSTSADEHSGTDATPEILTISQIKANLKAAEANLDANRADFEKQPELLLESARICTDYHKQSRFTDMSAEVLNARVFSKLSETTSQGIASMRMGDIEITPNDLAIYFAEGSNFGKHFSSKRLHLCDTIWKNTFLQKDAEPKNQKLSQSQKERPTVIESEIDEDKKDQTAESLTNENFFKESSHYVKNVRKSLQQHAINPVSLFEFAFHPTSYAKTVENLYYLSFSVRDGHCKVTEADGVIFVQSSKDKASTTDFKAGFKRKSFILSLEMHQWEKIVKKYKIEKSLLP